MIFTYDKTCSILSNQKGKYKGIYTQFDYKKTGLYYTNYLNR